MALFRKRSVYIYKLNTESDTERTGQSVVQDATQAGQVLCDA
jgi:hypothetical protein